MGRNVFNPSVIEADPIPRAWHVTHNRSHSATKTASAFLSAPYACAVCEFASPSARHKLLPSHYTAVMVALVLVSFGSAIAGAILGAYLQRRWTPDPSAKIVALREELSTLRQSKKNPHPSKVEGAARTSAPGQGCWANDVLRWLPASEQTSTCILSVRHPPAGMSYR